MSLVQKINQALLMLTIISTTPIRCYNTLFNNHINSHRAIISSILEEKPAPIASNICSSTTIISTNPATLNFDDQTTTLINGATTLTATGNTLFINQNLVCNEGLKVISGNLVVFGNLIISGEFSVTNSGSITVLGDIIADGLSTPAALTANIEGPIFVRGNIFFQNYNNSGAVSGIGVRIASPITAQTITFNNNSGTIEGSGIGAGVLFEIPINFFGTTSTAADAIVITNNSGINTGTGIGAGVLFQSSLMTANIITITNNRGTNNGSGTGVGSLFDSSLTTADNLNINNNQGMSSLNLGYGTSFVSASLVADNVTINNNNGTGGVTGIGLTSSSSHINTITLTHTGNTGNSSSEDLSGAVIAIRPS